MLRGLRHIRFFAMLPLLVVSVLLLLHADASKLGNIAHGGSLQSRRWERMDGKALGTSNGNSLQSTVQLASSGRACGFFLWDAPSAFLHRWCYHLLKDCVYEGLGGRKVMCACKNCLVVGLETFFFAGLVVGDAHVRVQLCCPFICSLYVSSLVRCFSCFIHAVGTVLIVV